MILDLPRFIDSERPYWNELDTMLNKREADPYGRLTFDQVNRLQYLYGRCSSALARLSTFSAEPQTREYLESLVARAYAECHGNRARTEPFRPVRWLRETFPQTFRKHLPAFWLSLGVTVFGTVFGSAALLFDPAAKTVLMPFSSLRQSPAERIRQEETSRDDRLAGHKSTFSAQLMTHNMQVAFLTFATGATWGLGSLLLLFYNGVALGAVAADYIHAGFAPFLLGWLLPHGVIEIPAILIAGQAGFVLASALIGWTKASRKRQLLRGVATDLLTLAGGAALMLIWAGIVEAFFSQYHQPVLPYALKIGFGLIELSALIFYLSHSGKHASDTHHPH
ncbi:MAG: stage II sporulation protein M [Acidobacteriaceae bacterium]|nr:stage II sporulation protein M [Acidobacteriaceae bacterium]